MADEANQTWFLTTALLVAPNGAHTAISGLTPGDNERDVRLGFMESLLNEQGPKGWAVKEVMAVPLAHLDISPKAAPTEAAE